MRAAISILTHVEAGFLADSKYDNSMSASLDSTGAMENADGGLGSVVLIHPHALSSTQSTKSDLPQCQAHRIAKPKAFVESVRLDSKHMNERRNMVKMPPILTLIRFLTEHASAAADSVTHHFWT